MSRRKDGLIVNDGLWREYTDSSTDCSACSARQEAMVHGVIARSGLRVFFSKEKNEGYGDEWRRRVLLQWDSHHWFNPNEPGQSISLNDCHRDSMLRVSWSLRRLIRSQVHWVILWFLEQLTPQSSVHFIVTCKKGRVLKEKKTVSKCCLNVIAFTSLDTFPSDQYEDICEHYPTVI